jgi:hypothetical protein
MLMILDGGASTKTGADGTFAFEDVAPGTWLVGPPPHATHVPLGSPVDVPAGVPVVEIVLRLPPELFVRGVVLDPDGAPVGGAALYACGSAIYRAAVSTLDGSFRLGPFPAGAVMLDVFRAPDGFAGAASVEANAGDADVVLRLTAAATLTVWVLDERGEPVAGELRSSRIDAPKGLDFWREDRIGDDGHARKKGLAPGLYEVLAEARDGRLGRLGPLRIDAGADVEVTLVVHPGGRLRVHVRGERPAPEVRVWLGSLPLDVLRSDDARVTETKPLPPGPVRVEVARDDGGAVARWATVIAGETVDVVFD